MSNPNPKYQNPFKPGAGHMPPYLAGRDKEKAEFFKLLEQKTILTNLVLTGLRGVGKTVLLDTFRPLVIQKRWLWVGTDLSESASVSEEVIAQRLLADLSVVTAGVKIKKQVPPIGFQAVGAFEEKSLNFATLSEIYKSIPGLVSDKLKGILQFVWECLMPHGINGIIFAYDEAQTMSDHAEKEQYPLSLLLDVFQSIQKKNIPFMLVLVGLPTLFPKLVEARTFAERMFDVVTLNRLNEDDSKQAIAKPIKDGHSSVNFDDKSIVLIFNTSGGYPYFIQFICKEIFDIWVQQLTVDGSVKPIPMAEITQKLDKDFFAGRWARATDRQRELLSIIATLENSDGEFTVQEIVVAAKHMAKPFGSSQVNQMLVHLSDCGLVYKNRHGKYSFAVPLLGEFILRQEAERTKTLFT
ncbi:MAG: ATP-binding protein [Verrucomicrobiia bacterium]